MIARNRNKQKIVISQYEKSRNNRLNEHSSKIIKLIEALSESEKLLEKKTINDLIFQRKSKKQLQKEKQKRNVYHDMLKPGDAVPRVFSNSKPINTGIPFLDHKQKAQLLTSDRAYTRKKNGKVVINEVVSGVYRNMNPEEETDEQVQEFIDRKFSDYDRTVTEQSGSLRILYRKRRGTDTIVKKPIYSTKKSSNFFSTFESNNNNFYKDPFMSSRDAIGLKKTRAFTEESDEAFRTNEHNIFPNMGKSRKFQTNNILSKKLKTENF